MTIQSDSMELCGDIIQDFVGQHLQISELESQANFPEEMRKLSEILARVEEYN